MNVGYIIPIVFLVKSYYELIQQELRLNKQEIILPSVNNTLKLWFFVIGKLASIPGLFLAVHSLSCVNSKDFMDTSDITIENNSIVNS